MTFHVLGPQINGSILSRSTKYDDCVDGQLATLCCFEHIFFHIYISTLFHREMSLPRAHTLEAIRQQGGSAYCYIRSAQRRTDDRRPPFRVYVKPRRGHSTRPIGFEDKVHDVQWKSFSNLSRDALLLVPPRRLAATDISEFVRIHGNDGWRELCEHMRRVWPVGCYASTHGHGEPYLHIRFERHVKYALPEGAQLVKRRRRSPSLMQAIRS